MRWISFCLLSIVLVSLSRFPCCCFSPRCLALAPCKQQASGAYLEDEFLRHGCLHGENAASRQKVRAESELFPVNADASRQKVNAQTRTVFCLTF